MTTIAIVIGVFMIIISLVVAWLFYRKISQLGKPSDDKSLLLLQNQLQDLSKSVEDKLKDSNQILREQFSNSNKIIVDVTEKLTKLDQTNKQVLTFSDQLNKLQETLTNPKHRGVLGEYYLETLLKTVFSPKQYQLQYEFKDGKKVDVALFVGDKIIPIDSKFSLENYNRIIEEGDIEVRNRLENLFKADLKKRIDETAQYIRPQEGTTDYAFMFIPAEGIYYDLLVNKVGAVKVNTRDLLEYASRDKKVYIVSPTTFYVTLQTLWKGERNYKIQESTKLILERVNMLGRHIKAYEEYMKKLGNNLGTTIGTYNIAYKELGKIDKDVTKLTGLEESVEPELLDKPKEDD